MWYTYATLKFVYDIGSKTPGSVEDLTVKMDQKYEVNSLKIMICCNDPTQGHILDFSSSAQALIRAQNPFLTRSLRMESERKEFYWKDHRRLELMKIFEEQIGGQIL